MCEVDDAFKELEEALRIAGCDAEKSNAAIEKFLADTKGKIRRIEALTRWFAGEGWKIYAGGYKNFYPKSCQDDPPADHVIAERKDYDVTTVDLTELCGFLEAREF